MSDAQVVSYTPPATVEDFIRDFIPGDLFYNFIIGPYGCLAGETLVLTEYGPTPISQIDRPMRVLSWNETTCRFQLSWCGGSFPKGRDCLRRVSTQAGEFDAAEAHRILCVDGEYRQVQQLRVGDGVKTYSQSQHPSVRHFCQQESHEDALRLNQTLVDSLERYAVSARRYGQRFLREEENDRGSAPLPDDAQKSKGFCDSFEAAQTRDSAELLQAHSQYGLSDDPTQTDGSQPQPEHPGRDEQPSTAVRFFVRIGAVSQSILKYLKRKVLRRRAPTLYGDCRSYKAPCWDRTKRATITTKTKTVKQAYWDLQVADTNNYVTIDGAIHHNSGKTTGNFFKIIHMAMLQAPSPLDGKRKTKVVVVRNTAPQLLDTTIPSWNLWFKDGQAGRWIAGLKTFQLRFGDVECDIMFRPLDTPDDVARVLSLEVTFAVLDEFVEIPQEIVDALSGRCGRYPQANEWPESLPESERGATNYGMWGASNPGNEDSWWYRHLVEERPGNVKYYHQPSGLSEQAENLKGLKGGRKYYENLAQGKSDAWVNQFIHAEWGYSVAGKPVVPTFNRALHVALNKLPLDPNLPLVIGYDPGVRHSALIFGQFDFYGRLHVLRELILEGYGTRRMLDDRLLPILRMYYPNIEVVIAPDPAAGQRAQNDESSSLDVLKEKKYRDKWTIKTGNSNLLTPRLEAIEHYTTRITEKGPALVVDLECKTLIRALVSGWKYVVNKNGNDRPEPDKNAFSHPGDAFGYLCQYGHQGEVRHGRRTNARPRSLQTYPNTYNLR